MTKKIGRIIYQDWVEMVNSLEETDQAKAWNIIMKYNINDPVPKITDKHLAFVINYILKRVVENEIKYNDKCKKNKAAAEKRWQNIKNNANAYGRKKNLTNLIEDIQNE
jgi:hypothetical protein